VFVVAYIGGADEPLGPEVAGLRRLGGLFAAAVGVELCVAIIGSGLSKLDTRGAHVSSGFGTPAQIGTLLLNRFLIPFEVASYLLLIAAVGALVLARRRRGHPDVGALERIGHAPQSARTGR
jgi:NADH-quinone oxidoreductase subunit J